MDKSKKPQVGDRIILITSQYKFYCNVYKRIRQKIKGSRIKILVINEKGGV